VASHDEAEHRAHCCCHGDRDEAPASPHGTMRRGGGHGHAHDAASCPICQLGVLVAVPFAAQASLATAAAVSSAAPARTGIVPVHRFAGSTSARGPPSAAV
jgi:hypothetical protein